MVQYLGRKTMTERLTEDSHPQKHNLDPQGPIASFTFHQELLS